MKTIDRYRDAWECTQCGNFNDYPTVRCECGEEYREPTAEELFDCTPPVCRGRRRLLDGSCEHAMCKAADVYERFSFGVTAGHWCDGCWKVSGYVTDREFDPTYAGERMDPIDGDFEPDYNDGMI